MLQADLLMCVHFRSLDVLLANCTVGSGHGACFSRAGREQGNVLGTHRAQSHLKETMVICRYRWQEDERDLRLPSWPRWLVWFRKLIVPADISPTSGLRMKMTVQTRKKKMIKDMNYKEGKNRRQVHRFGLSAASLLTPSPQKLPWYELEEMQLLLDRGHAAKR